MCIYIHTIFIQWWNILGSNSMCLNMGFTSPWLFGVLFVRLRFWNTLSIGWLRPWKKNSESLIFNDSPLVKMCQFLNSSSWIRNSFSGPPASRMAAVCLMGSPRIWYLDIFGSSCSNENCHRNRRYRQTQNPWFSWKNNYITLNPQVSTQLNVHHGFGFSLNTTKITFC